MLKQSFLKFVPVYFGAISKKQCFYYFYLKFSFRTFRHIQLQFHISQELLVLLTLSKTC